MRLCNLFGIWVFCFHSLQLEYDSVETSHQTQTLLFTTEQKAVSWFHAWITTQFTVDLHWGAKQRPLIDTYSKGCRERITWNHIWIHLSKSSTAGIRVERLQVWVQCFLSESISAVIVKRRQNIYVFCFVHSDHKLLFYEYLDHKPVCLNFRPLLPCHWNAVTQKSMVCIVVFHSVFFEYHWGVTKSHFLHMRV